MPQPLAQHVARGIVPRDAGLVHAPPGRLADDQQARARADAEHRLRLEGSLASHRRQARASRAHAGKRNPHPLIIEAHALAARRAVAARRPIRQDRGSAARSTSASRRSSATASRIELAWLQALAAERAIKRAEALLCRRPRPRSQSWSRSSPRRTPSTSRRSRPRPTTTSRRSSTGCSAKLGENAEAQRVARVHPLRLHLRGHQQPRLRADAARVARRGACCRAWTSSSRRCARSRTRHAGAADALAHARPAGHADHARQGDGELRAPPRARARPHRRGRDARQDRTARSATTTRTSSPIPTSTGSASPPLRRAPRPRVQPLHHADRAARLAWPSCSTPTRAPTPSCSTSTATSGATSRSATSARRPRRARSAPRPCRTRSTRSTSRTPRATSASPTRCCATSPTSCRCRAGSATSPTRPCCATSAWRSATALLAYASCLRGLGKLEADPARLAADLDANWEVLAEAVQTVMRRHGVPEAYEKLKELTRGKRLERAQLAAFVKALADSRRRRRSACSRSRRPSTPASPPSSPSASRIAREESNDLRRDDLPVVVPAVSGAAADRAADPALVRRQRGGVDHLHAVLPGSAARRLRLRAPPRAEAATRPAPADHPYGAARRGGGDAADLCRRRRGSRAATRSRSAASCSSWAPRSGCRTCSLASTSPLLQAWFARARPGENPYRLFAISNLASLVALVGYPFVVEPFLAAREQVSALVVALRRICGPLRRGGLAHPARPRSGSKLRQSRRRSPGSRSGCGSRFRPPARCCLLAVTNHLTQNVASVPLLWLVPLTLYLLTFIIAFEGRELVPAAVRVAVRAGVRSVAWRGCWSIRITTTTWRCSSACSCRACSSAAFSATASSTACGPTPRQLTAFYLIVSAGGALGGLLVAVVAPLVFNGYYELGVGTDGARAARGACASPSSAASERWRASACCWASRPAPPTTASPTTRRARVRAQLLRRAAGEGVRRRRASESHLRRLVHGTIMHGEQYLERAPRRMRPPTTRRPRASASRSSRAGARPMRVGVIGLGTGTIAAYGRPGDVYRFYDIDPRVMQHRAQRVHLPRRQPGEGRGRAGRCAPHARARAAAELRRARGRRFLERRHPGAPHHPRGARRLPAAHEAATASSPSTSPTASST